MKLLILSDSHGTRHYMDLAVDRERPEGIIHLGDHERDAANLAARYPEIPVWTVSGNCDPGLAPEKLIRELQGVRLYMTHGHTLRVKYGLLRAELAAREEGADVLLFGHTHSSLCDWHNGLWMLNPGSCSGRGPITYGLLTLSQGEVQAKICEIRRDDAGRLEE